MDFILHSDFAPTGDQPEAIAGLTRSLREGTRHNTLLGVTGSGKTFTMANVIKNIGKPTLILSHNKTLAAQLYGEFRSFFRKTPSNISFPITITTSPKPTCRPRIPTSRKTFRSTTKSRNCA